VNNDLAMLSRLSTGSSKMIFIKLDIRFIPGATGFEWTLIFKPLSNSS
jgi:hypothetical protein